MFKLGDEVTWKSQSQGAWLTKTGTIVEVVAINNHPNRERFSCLYTGAGVGFARKHESYVVQVGRRIYWPRVSALQAKP